MLDIVIAVRGGGKSRLSGILDEAGRESLVVAMLVDMLDRLAGRRLHVLTPTPALAHIAQRMGANVFADRGEGLNHAFAAARAGLAAAQPDASFLALPGDLPCVTTAEIDAMIEALRPWRAVLAPAGRGGGTGAVLLPPGLPFSFAFGPGSLAVHLDADAVTVHAAGLALDIDTRADVDAFLALCEDGRTRQLLSSMPIAR